jgi:hypothetical protein
MPGRNEARAMSAMAIAAGLILCGISIFRGFHGQTFMGRPVGGDFVEFYTIGKIFNDFDAARIYDLKLAVGLQHSVLPSMAETQMLVFGHAPYIALLFRPLALLPYLWAYAAWLVFSAALYLTALNLLFRATGIPQEDRAIAFLLAVSFMPFIFETWIGGQLSVVMFFLWTLFFYLRNHRQLFLAGIAIGLGVFKPTLVALPLAMLFLGRRWRVLQGFATGAAAATALSFRLVGLDGCRAWLDTLLFNGRMAAGQGEAWHLAKSVDMSSFFHLLLFNAAPLTSIVLAGAGLLALVILGVVWWRSSSWTESPAAAEDWLWAGTLCLTLVVSSYAPVYDAILVVIAAALAERACRRQGREERMTSRGWLLLLYMAAWLTQSMAEFLHLQIYTVVLAGVGFWALRMAYAKGSSERAWQPIDLLGGRDLSMPSKKVLRPSI